MFQFQPPGFRQRLIETSLGSMVYYIPVAVPGLVVSQTPPIVFLHSLGGGSSAYEWSKVYPAFAASYPVLAPDLIGWGQSDHPARDYQVMDYLTILAEFIQQVANPPIAVVASSLTAALTIRLAIQRPELFQALFLVGPSGLNDFGLDYGRGLAAQLARTPLLDRLIYTLGAANEVAVRNFLQQFLFAQPQRISKELVAAYVASAQQPNAEYAALASLRGDLCFDLALYIEQLTVPTVLLWGEQSWFSGIDIGRRLAQLNPQAIQAFQPIADVGVLPHLELPGVLIGLLQRYFVSLLAPGALASPLPVESS